MLPPPGPRPLSPDDCSWFSYLTLSWVTPLILKGRKTASLTLHDLPSLAGTSFDGQRIGAALELAFDGNLWSAIKACHAREFFSGLPAFFVMVGCFCASPFLVQAMLRFMLSPGTPAEEGYILVLYLCIVSLCQAFAMSVAFVQSTALGTRLRVGLAVLVFRKSLRLSASARAQISEGDVLNLMSADAERVFMACLVGHALTYGAMMLASVMVILSVQVGVAGFAAIMLAMCLLPLTARIGRTLGKQKRKMLVFTDKRVSFMTEVITGILTVKMQAWESKVAERVRKMRQDEMVHGAQVLTLLSLNAWLTFMLPPLMAALCFGILIIYSPQLTLPTVYAVLSFLFSTILSLELIPRAAGAFAQAFVSLTRIEAFLNLPDAPPSLRAPPDASLDVQMTDVALTAVQRADQIAKKKKPGLLSQQYSLGRSFRFKPMPDAPLNGPVAGGGGGVAVRGKGAAQVVDAIASRAGGAGPALVWTRVLSHVNLSIGRGELAVVVGKVGAGKTSLLTAVLNEIECSGAVMTRQPKGAAYAAQEPWIQNASLRDNILFGCAQQGELPRPAVDEDLYSRVIDATALEQDLLTLPRGDATEIGSRGINLSGGQKARVALARALYRAAQDAEVNLVVLDDPFSALDPHVASTVWAKAVEQLLKGKTVLCALNSNIHLASRADRVLLLQDGKVMANGAPKVVFEDPRFAWLFDARSTSQHSPQQQLPHQPPSAKRDPPASIAQTSVDALSSPDAAAVPPLPTAGERKHNLYQGEEPKEGAVSRKTYWAWLRAGSATPGLSAGLILGLYLVTQAVKVFMDLWLGLYVSHRAGVVWPYFASAGALLCLSLARALAFAALSARASRRLHDDLVSGLLAAPVNLFFDVTPVGRITNRLSSDVDQLDTRLPETVFQLLNAVFTILGSLVMAIWAAPWFLLAFVPVVMLFAGVASVFARTSRQIKRIESVSRSPLYSHFGETLSGLVTVRAMHATGGFAEENVRLVNTNAKAHAMFWFASRWFALRTDLLAVVAQVAVCALVLSNRASINPAVAGLAIVYSLQLTTTVQSCTRFVIETENSMVSCERIGEMTEHIPKERAGGQKDFRSTAGRVAFERVCARYRPDLDLVIRDLSFEVPGGSRVGVCGRTGAGKSSLGQILFGMLPLASGRVLIDGADVAAVGLPALRRTMAVIPQMPVLFSGSVRFALDPWGDVLDDARLWAVLEQCEIAVVIRRLSGGLDAQVDEGGSNFSTGERQLLCVARALLRQSRVVLIDEGTASVDASSDALVQKAIAGGFVGATVITIAHRMHTIVGSDLILVLSRGSLVEFAPPAELLQRPESVFRALWMEEQQSAAAGGS